MCKRLSPPPRSGRPASPLCRARGRARGEWATAARCVQRRRARKPGLWTHQLWEFWVVFRTQPIHPTCFVLSIDTDSLSCPACGKQRESTLAAGGRRELCGWTAGLATPAMPEGRQAPCGSVLSFYSFSFFTSPVCSVALLVCRCYLYYALPRSAICRCAARGRRVRCLAAFDCLPERGCCLYIRARHRLSLATATLAAAATTATAAAATCTCVQDPSPNR